ncbi:hypothetical protein EMIHUDRAFT_257283, partial [Emiliania huxleyi CCMP1516]|uniref:Thioredoxin domain-containing protein n=2 Tax=Emiliania huxleyi TaxID=2903 RepID=A0A0D3IL29_EMIH1
MALRSLTLLCAAAGASAGAIELTPDNFDELMKPDWDSLASTFEDSKKVLIADVDCTTGGKPLCEKYGVRGYPTIKYFNPPDEEGEDYKGGRSLDELKKFAENELGP